MGFFSEIASEARRNTRSAATSQPAAPEQGALPREAPPQSAPAAPEPEPAPPEPVPPQPEPAPAPEQPPELSAHTPPPPELKCSLLSVCESPF